jgi:hypothetical protein
MKPAKLADIVYTVGRSVPILYPILIMKWWWYLYKDKNILFDITTPYLMVELGLKIFCAFRLTI